MPASASSRPSPGRLPGETSFQSEIFYLNISYSVQIAGKEGSRQNESKETEEEEWEIKEGCQSSEWARIQGRRKGEESKIGEGKLQDVRGDVIREINRYLKTRTARRGMSSSLGWMLGDKILPKWNDVEIRWYNSDDGISVLFFFHSPLFRTYSETVKYNYAVIIENTVRSKMA